VNGREGEQQAGPHDRTRMVARVRKVALCAQRNGMDNWRRVRLRRPFGWSRDDFSTFLSVNAEHGRWGYTLGFSGDVAVLEVTDALLEEAM